MRRSDELSWWPSTPLPMTPLQAQLRRLRDSGGDERRDAELCLLIADASRYDPTAPCPHGCGDTNDHRATKAQVSRAERTVGDTLCPRVQRTHKKGEAGLGQDPKSTYFHPPTQEQIARWNLKDEGDQRAETRRKIRESQEEIIGAAK